MEPLTIEEAIEIRKRLKAQRTKETRIEVNVINNILAGYYDQIKDPLQVAKDDIEFLNDNGM